MGAMMSVRYFPMTDAQIQAKATIAAALMILSAATLAASYIPARRAAAIDPISALRSD